MKKNINNFESETYVTDKKIVTKLSVITGILLIIYFPNFKWLLHVWDKDPNFSFGYFIPIISAYLIYRKYEQIKRIPIELTGVGYFGLIIIFIGASLYIIASILEILSISTYSLFIILFGATYNTLGKNISKHLIFPLLFLFVMVPISDILISPISLKLKYISSSTAVEIIKLFNVPVFKEGVVIHLTNSTLEVVDACSGLRSLISLFIVSFLLVYIKRNTIIRKASLLIFTIPIAILSNIIRILVLCFISETYNQNLTDNKFVHNLSGILVFIIGLALLLLIEKLINFNSDITKNEN